MHIHIHIYISFKTTLASLGDVYIQNYLLSKETSQTQRGRSSRQVSSINSGYSLAFSGKPVLPGAAAAPSRPLYPPRLCGRWRPSPFLPGRGPELCGLCPGWAGGWLCWLISRIPGDGGPRARNPSWRQVSRASEDSRLTRTPCLGSGEGVAVPAGSFLATLLSVLRTLWNSGFAECC